MRTSDNLHPIELSVALRKVATRIGVKIHEMHTPHNEFIPNAEWTVWAEFENEEGWELDVLGVVVLTDEHLTEAIKLAESTGNPSYPPTDYEAPNVKPFRGYALQADSQQPSRSGEAADGPPAGA